MAAILHGNVTTMYRYCLRLVWLCHLSMSTVAFGQAQMANSDQDWAVYGGDAGGQRYSTRTQITKSNVSHLQIAWIFHTGAFKTQSSASNRKANFEATPVLWEGKLFFDTPFDELFAIDATTGKQVWSYDPAVNREAGIYIVSSRGVALWHGRGRRTSNQRMPVRERDGVRRSILLAADPALHGSILCHRAVLLFGTVEARPTSRVVVIESSSRRWIDA